jgi:hypothetical protein
MKKRRPQHRGEEAFERKLREQLSTMKRIAAPSHAVDSLLRRIREGEAADRTVPLLEFGPSVFRRRLVTAVLFTLIVSTTLTYLLTRTLAPAPARRTYVVRFVYENETADTVHLMGDFNNWRRDSLSMTKIDETPYWAAEVVLTEGIYKYVFLVDDEEWTIDPLAPLRVKDNFGHENSLIVLVDDDYNEENQEL